MATNTTTKKAAKAPKTRRSSMFLDILKGTVRSPAAKLGAIRGLVLHHRTRHCAGEEERSLEVDVQHRIPVIVAHAHQ